MINQEYELYVLIMWKLEEGPNWQYQQSKVTVLIKP